MKSESSDTTRLFLRYLFLLFLGLGNLYLIYKILTPITISSVTFILSLFQEVSTISDLIILKNFTIQIVPACVAGFAYYLLLILIFSTPKITLKKRFNLVLLSVGLFFILNIARILFLISIVGKPYFFIVHWIFWNLMSTIFVVGIWILLVKLYKIKELPLVSDFRYLLRLKRKSK